MENRIEKAKRWATKAYGWMIISWLVIVAFKVLGYVQGYVHGDQILTAVIVALIYIILAWLAGFAVGFAWPPSVKTREQNPTTIDNLGLLERLDDLRQKGILTDAEFEREKKRTLCG